MKGEASSHSAVEPTLGRENPPTEEWKTNAPVASRCSVCGGDGVLIADVVCPLCDGDPDFLATPKKAPAKVNGGDAGSRKLKLPIRQRPAYAGFCRGFLLKTPAT